ncbi:hypothetical protein [Xenorhabdus innexi]|uniref:Uncharacterized protein n=1 Tax=Xenorhabdus innexi TaxID=290109 RepID=A0A1N6N1X2_9GAMM|nr:hypothetical protein [Xenorhabdus innexi]PHM37136.1 hypothetical protein Xinn_01103 [Xenorhabdus innexi]SIP75085.1 hypothetical protein XIS1_900120 [Xenorhabdus innexi]
MSTPKIALEITRTTAEELTSPSRTVSDEILADFVTDLVVEGLLSVGFPESEVNITIADD